jgi:hypothetical protein
MVVPAVVSNLASTFVPMPMTLMWAWATNHLDVLV